MPTCKHYPYNHVDMTENYCRQQVYRHYNIIGVFYEMHNMELTGVGGNCDEVMEILMEKIKPLIDLHAKKGLTFTSNGEGKNICDTRQKYLNAFVIAFQEMHTKEIGRLPKYVQRRIGWI